MANADPTIDFDQALTVFNNPEAIKAVDVKSQTFVKSLLSQHKSKGSLSTKQRYWLRVYAEKVQHVTNSPKVDLSGLSGGSHSYSYENPFHSEEKKVKALQAYALKSGLPVTVVGGVVTAHVGTALLDMLKKATAYAKSKGTAYAKSKGSKKGPAIKFDKTDSAPKLKFHLATQASKNFGSVIISNGEAYAYNQFYGKITSEGVLMLQPSACNKPGLFDFVAEFAMSPHKLGSAYGLSTFKCCFCSKPITTNESKSMGYGPVCADKYGLPWGKTDPKILLAGDYHSTTQKKNFDFPEFKKLIEKVSGDKTLSKLFDGGDVAIAPPPLITNDPNMYHVVLNEYTIGKSIGLIKAVRKLTGFGLKESKELVESVASSPVTVLSTFDKDKATKAYSLIMANYGGGHIVEPKMPVVEEEPEPVVEVTAADIGFSCETCLDTGKDITPTGRLVDCSACKPVKIPIHNISITTEKGIDVKTIN